MTLNESKQLKQILDELIKSNRIVSYTDLQDTYFTITVNTKPLSYVRVYNGNFDYTLKELVDGINKNTKLYKNH